jgi:hypothetical protein
VAHTAAGISVGGVATLRTLASSVRERKPSLLYTEPRCFSIVFGLR